MGYFSKYRPLYKEPERITPSEARARRFEAMLEKERRFAELPNFSVKLGQLQKNAALSRVSKTIVNEPSSHDRKMSGHKAASIAAALKNFKESDFADPAKRKLYRALRAQQVSQKVKPSASDKRQFNPTGKDFSTTIYGTLARVTGARHALGKGLSASSWMPAFIHPSQVIPCIQRKVRREVMHALGRAGRGYHTKKRRSYSSGVPC